MKGRAAGRAVGGAIGALALGLSGLRAHAATGVTLRAEALTHDGQPACGLELWVLPLIDVAGSEPQVARTDPEGHAVIPVVAGGMYWVDARLHRAPGLRLLDKEIRIPADVDRMPPLTLTLPRFRTIRGRVLAEDTGSPVSTGVVRCLRLKGDGLWTARVESDGTFEVEPLVEPDDYFLRFEDEAGGLRSRRWEQRVRVEEYVTRVDLPAVRVVSATCRLCTTDAEAMSFAGRFALSDSGGGTACGAVTGGVFRIERVVPGPASVSFFPTNDFRIVYRAQVELPRDGRSDPIDVPVTPVRAPPRAVREEPGK